MRPRETHAREMHAYCRLKSYIALSATAGERGVIIVSQTRFKLLVEWLIRKFSSIVVNLNYDAEESEAERKELTSKIEGERVTTSFDIWRTEGTLYI